MLSIWKTFLLKYLSAIGNLFAIGNLLGLNVKYDVPYN